MKQLLSLIFLISLIDAAGQEWKGKFEQLGEMLPTPNTYRSSSGAPGPAYWQQRADYAIHVEVNDQNQALAGSETITYYNQAPEPLLFLWLQLDQNLRERGWYQKGSSFPDQLYHDEGRFAATPEDRREILVFGRLVIQH